MEGKDSRRQPQKFGEGFVVVVVVNLVNVYEINTSILNLTPNIEYNKLKINIKDSQS